MLDRLKDILGTTVKKEGLPARLPVVPPFASTEPETAPERIHKPGRIRTDIDHTGHMRVIAHNDADAKALGTATLQATREKKTVVYGEDIVSAYLADFACLKFITITGNSDTLCSFPFFNMGTPADARITEIIECKNGYEGQLGVYVKGSVINFFDALYFKNRNTYFPGKDARVLISGIAYVLTKKRAGKTVPEPADSDLAFHYDNGDVDDYVFRGKVLDVKEYRVLDKRVQVIKVAFRTGADSVLDLYVCVTANALRETIVPGDHVSGILWLQGFVV